MVEKHYWSLVIFHLSFSISERSAQPRCPICFGLSASYNQASGTFVPTDKLKHIGHLGCAERPEMENVKWKMTNDK